jgi:DNA-binding CsgD family transcriptional regulator
MLAAVSQITEALLAAQTPELASRAYFGALKSYGATYLQTRHYQRPAATLTSESHFAAGGVIARIAPTTWPGSPGFNYICFDQNPLIGAIREGRTRYRFSDFAPRNDAKFGTYWEALSEAGIGDAVCATSYGADRMIASLHLGFSAPAFSPGEAEAIEMSGLILTEKIMSLGTALAASTIQLTARERDCLAYVAEGKSDWEISVILSISQATVRFHVDNARTKLDAVNRTQAVARFINLRMM